MNLIEIGMVSDIGRVTSPVDDLIVADVQLVDGKGNSGLLIGPLGHA
jgi:hypothetical protein